MKVIDKVLVCSAIALSGLAVSGATQELPQVEILGKNYYVYKSKKGESLFGIARDNNWDYTLLQTLNPKAMSPLPKGFSIYYPAPDATPAPTVTDEIVLDSPVLYTIKRGDTLSSLAKRYNTTVAAIMKANPGVSEKNFKADAKIKIPASGTGLKKVTETIEEEQLKSFDSYKVEKNDDWESVASKTGVDVEDLKDVNKNVGNKLKNKSVIAIPNIEKITKDTVIVYEDPRELTLDGIQEIYEDVHGISDSVQFMPVKLVVLLSEPTTKRDLEFTRGVLAAANKMKYDNSSLQLTVVDGNKSSSDVLTNLAELNPDMVLLTSEKGIPDYLSEYAEVSQTPLINTFDIRSDLYTKNPYVIQLLTPSNFFNEETAQNLVDNYGEYTLIAVGTSDDSDLVLDALKEKWTPSKFKQLSIEGLKKATFRPDGKFLFYGNPTKKDEVEEILKVVAEKRNEYPLANMVTFGRPNWIVYEETMKGDMHKANTIIPSRFYYDPDDSRSKDFMNHYTRLFSRQPSKSYPVYAAVGFDSALYFVNQFSNSKGDINAFMPSTDGAQNDFELVRPDNWTGMYNPLIYFIRFTPYETIEKTVIK